MNSESLTKIFGKETVDRIHSSKVLVVGAGGIGCELLKNLVMTGFQNIEIIDLDTIDLSNLNRQFLFQKQHIKKPKAVVARDSVLKFNPKANIVSHFASVFDEEYDLDWFRSFNLVLNALDNIAARRHVNKMCLAADIPLVESGTAGYHGQVSVHFKDITCYDCVPKPIEKKSYPVCTIRSTPSEPIHCIVWAKSYLFNTLFGIPEEEEVSPDDDANEVSSLKKEAEALKQMCESIGKPEAAKKVFTKVFSTDINRLLSMEDLWKTRQKPTPLEFKKVKEFKQADQLKFDQSVWTLEENISIFLQTIDELGKLLIAEREKDPKYAMSFDKDDELALNFVTATANLRAHIFHIEEKSRFAVKEMAGNIIPAIATTNAIVAGMMIVLAIKVLSNQKDQCQYSFLAYGGDRTHYLMNEPLQKPNPKCAICSNNYITITIELEKPLSALIELVREMNISGDLTIQDRHRLLYDIDFEDNLESSLESLGIKKGTQLTITNDDDDDFNNYSIIAGEPSVEYSSLKPRPTIEPVINENGKREGEELQHKNTKEILMDYNGYEYGKPYEERDSRHIPEEWDYNDRCYHTGEPGTAYYPGAPELYEHPGSYGQRSYPNDYPPYPLYPEPPQYYDQFPTSHGQWSHSPSLSQYVYDYATYPVPPRSPERKLGRVSLSPQQNTLYGPLIQFLKKLYPLPSFSGKIGVIFDQVKSFAPPNWKVRDYLNGAARLSIIDVTGEDQGQLKIVLNKDFAKTPDDNDSRQRTLVSCRYCGIPLTTSFAAHNLICKKEPNMKKHLHSNAMDIDVESKRKPVGPTPPLEKRPKLSDEITQENSKETISSDSISNIQPTNNFSSRLATYIPDRMSPADTSMSGDSNPLEDNNILPPRISKEQELENSRKRKSSTKIENLDIIHNDEFNFDLIHQTDYLGVRKTRSGKVYIPNPVVDLERARSDSDHIDVSEDESIETVSLQSDYEPPEVEEVVDVGSVESESNTDTIKVSQKRRTVIVSDSDESENDIPMINIQRKSIPIVDSPSANRSESPDLKRKPLRKGDLTTPTRTKTPDVMSPKKSPKSPRKSPPKSILEQYDTPSTSIGLVGENLSLRSIPNTKPKNAPFVPNIKRGEAAGLGLNNIGQTISSASAILETREGNNRAIQRIETNRYTPNLKTSTNKTIEISNDGPNASTINRLSDTDRIRKGIEGSKLLAKDLKKKSGNPLGTNDETAKISAINSHSTILPPQPQQVKPPTSKIIPESRDQPVPEDKVGTSQEFSKAIHIEKPLNTRERIPPPKIIAPIDIPEVYAKSYRKTAAQRQNSSPTDNRIIKFAQDTRFYVSYSESEDFGLLPDLSPNLKHPNFTLLPVKSNLKKTNYNPQNSITNFEEFGISPAEQSNEKKEPKRLSFSSYISSLSKKRFKEEESAEQQEVLDFSPVVGFGDSAPVISSPVLEKEYESISQNIAPATNSVDYVIPPVRNSSEVEEFLVPITANAVTTEQPPNNQRELVSSSIKSHVTEGVKPVSLPLKPIASAERKYDSNGRVVMCAKCKNVPLTEEHRVMHVVEALKEKQRKILQG
ncbi:E1 ubiquitin-activating protein uba2 [Boothiomyces sp. JEL0866]|nr:E1 ubiquitin-activating protein uba2 [Boothiomyces sp. JEL0866]